MAAAKKLKEAAEVLPVDVWESIFKRLGDEELKALALVSKDFLAISNICKDCLTVFDPGLGMLSKYLKRFKQLKTINLRLIEGDPDEAVLEIARSNICLEVLDIRYRHGFKSQSLKELCSKNLKVLECYVPGMQDEELVVLIANSFPNLEQLNIGRGDYSITYFGVELLSSKLKLLAKICFHGIHSLSDQHVVAFASNCVLLKDFSVLDCYGAGFTGLTEHGFGFLLRNRPSLEALLINGECYFGRSESAITIANSIGHAKALTSLELWDNVHILDELIIAIANSRLQLKTLVLMSYEKYTAVGLLDQDLSNYLCDLCLYGADITDSNLETLLSKDLPKLTAIELSVCEVTESTLFVLPTKCPSLEAIVMNDTEMSSTSYLNANVTVPAPKNSGIKYVDLARNYKIEDETLKEFGHVFPNLEVLDLSYCYRITNTGILYVLKGCKKIKRLELREYKYNMGKITEADSEVPELNLEALDLSNSHIVDEGISIIATKCPRLIELNLLGCKQVTTEGIKQIVKNIKVLSRLDIRDCTGVESAALLEWMLSTGFLSSLKRIWTTDIKKEQREEFWHRGCLLCKDRYD